MQRLTRTLVILATLGVAGAVAPVLASDGDRAFRGLVPPTSAFPSGAGKSQGLWTSSSRPGLRMLPDARRDEASVQDGITFYGGTRIVQQMGMGYAQPYSGLRYPFAANWSSALELSAEPALPASPRGYSLLGRIDRSLAGGWGLSLGLQYNKHEFSTPGTQMLPGHWLHPQNQAPYRTVSAYGMGYELKVSYRYGERNSVGLSFGSIRDIDFTRQWLGTLPAEGRQYSLTGQHWLTQDWTLSYGLVAHEQGGPRGQGLRLGLRYSF